MAAEDVESKGKDLYGNNSLGIVRDFVVGWENRGITVPRLVEQRLQKMSQNNPDKLKSLLFEQSRILEIGYEQVSSVYEEIASDGKKPEILGHLELDDGGIVLKGHYTQCPECHSYNTLHRDHITGEIYCNEPNCGFVDDTWAFA